ncbi:hypothetical protein XCR1_950001 [Xenorhabdus cabanillasii JM26]|uniref:Uncharacterized protein n=1 Tax=Xenorhabdus cabanillasii JM26 TaxID=1427517 RepID=W1JBW8_9GAMM|nr:hypothetical protein XCR1_950001 [Xenorhabdus cabanillasii JM26]
MAPLFYATENGGFILLINKTETIIEMRVISIYYLSVSFIL